MLVKGRKVIVSKAEVAEFNRHWPCSTLRSERAYWFEFDFSGALVDTDVPEQDDGPAATAMANDCYGLLWDSTLPPWAEGY